MNSGKSWVLLVDPSIYKLLARIPKRDARRIFSGIEELEQHPFLGDVQKMKGGGQAWRKRIGSYRIKYEIHAARKLIYVFDLQRRTSTTY